MLLLGISIGICLMLPVIVYQERVKAHWRRQTMLWLIRSVEADVKALAARLAPRKPEPETDASDWWKKP